MTKRKDRKHSAVVKMGEVPTKERQHQNGGVFSEIVECDVNGKALIKRYRAVWECPLDAYRDRKILTGPEHLAGLRFRKAYYKAILSRRATSERLRPYSLRPSVGLTTSEKILKEAYQTLPPYNKGIIIDICGHDLPARDQATLDKLKEGLGHLALRWHMASIEVCKRKR